MEFRLVYDGRLPAASQNDARAKDKHRIRRAFAPQLATLREVHPRLKHDARYGPESGTLLDLGDITPRLKHPSPGPAVALTVKGRQFVPLITKAHGIGCALDILFLRRDQPGGLVRPGGDIDNRIKVLFDALKMPTRDDEVFGELDDDPQLFHCLLEDDQLITELKVTTDRLLLPKRDDEEDTDVRLIVHVHTIVLDPGNLLAVSF